MRNPRLMLADMLSTIVEDADPATFPSGVDLGLLDWVDRSERLPLPWSTKGPEPGATLGDYRRLRDLRRWIFHDGPNGRRLFRPDADIAVMRTWFA